MDESVTNGESGPGAASATLGGPLIDLNRSGLVFSTYLGGDNYDDPLALEMDASGDIYVVGATQSADFPTTAGSFDPDGNIWRRDEFDGFVAKLSQDGTKVLACTFLGGTDYDICTDLEVLDTGEVLVLGRTMSRDFPVTVDAYQGILAGEVDIFLALLEPDLSNVTYATYLGGTGYDGSESVVVGPGGTVHVAGHSNSTDLPVTGGAFQQVKRGDGSTRDGFALGLDADLKSISYCTYLGGNGTEWVVKCDTDVVGNLFVAGNTFSTDFPTTAGANDTLMEDTVDCYVSRLGPDGQLLASTFVGGSSFEEIADLHVTTDGKVFVTGQTRSPDFPLTPDGLYPSRIPSVNSTDAFVNILDLDLTTMTYGTALGSKDTDGGTSVRYDVATGMVYLIGATDSRSLLNVTRGGYSDQYAGGDYDLFVLTFNLTNGSIEYCSYIGGSGWDLQTNVGSLLEVDERGHMFITLSTDSVDFPVTRHANMTGHVKHADGIVLRLNPEPFDRAQAPEVTREHGDGFVNLSWDLWDYDHCRVNEVRVFKDLTPTPPGNLVKRLAWPSATYYNDTFGLENGKKYYYWVSVVTSAGVGLKAGPIEGHPMGVPTAPRELRGTSGDGRVNLSWNPPEDDGGDLLHFQVLRGRAADELEVWNTSVPPTATGCVDGSVELGATYYYAVRAVNSRYVGTLSTILSVIPWRPPSEPGNLTYSLDDRTILLSWSAPASGGGQPLQGYNLSRSLNGLVWNRVDAALSPSDVNFSDTGRDYGQEYYYRLTAYHTLGEGPPGIVGPIIPYDSPMAPMDLRATDEAEAIGLWWSEPVSDNGRPVLDYYVYRSSSPDVDTMVHIDTVVAGKTTTIDTEVDVNVTYYYRVRARNLKGLGNWSGVVSERSLGVPGKPVGLDWAWSRTGVHLTWQRPVVTGGHSPLAYLIFRTEGQGEPEEIDSTLGTTEYLDTNVTPKTTYTYYVVANNTRHESDPSNILTLLYTGVPERVGNLRVAQRNQSLEVSWNQPLEDGGSAITLYNVSVYVKGTAEETWIIELFNTKIVQEGLTPGLTYVYRVRAKNANGYGEYSSSREWTFVGRPPPPVLSKAVVDPRDHVRLTWTWEKGNECGNCTGFIIERGDSLDAFSQLSEVALTYEYTDETTERGRTYFYRVISKSDFGSSEGSTPRMVKVPTAVEGGSDLLPWIVLAMLLVVMAVIATLYSRGRMAAAQEPVEGPSPPWRGPAEAPVAKGAAVPSVSAPPSGPDGILPYIAEEVFLVYRDGRLITSCAREECRTQDADLMSGMLIAIQGLIQDGLESGGTLESIKYGENLISIATGDHVVLAAVVYGRPDEDFQDVLWTTLTSIEGTYSGIIEEWSGDPSELEGVDALLGPLIDRTAYLTREDVGDVLADHGVALLSAVDFHRGYVRLKLAAVNATDETIIDSAIEVHYDGDMLRLERVDPETIVVRGDRIRLGNVKPGERKTVALLFDPQICQTTYLDGHISYYDSRGELLYVEMKRRNADVVCPVFFTRENANTAMLRRLLRERLHMSDLRVYRYPRSLSPEEVLAIGKRALGSDEVQLVREYVERAPAFEAEVWFYAETRVKGYQFVIRLGVVEDKGVLELFAASTAMEPVTGLLAEYRRELERIFQDTSEDQERVRLERDEDLRRTLERRTLRLEMEEPAEE